MQNIEKQVMVMFAVLVVSLGFAMVSTFKDDSLYKTGLGASMKEGTEGLPTAFLRSGNLKDIKPIKIKQSSVSKPPSIPHWELVTFIVYGWFLRWFLM